MAFTTKKSLLMRVREGEEVSWREFYATYKPLIFLCGGDCNLTQDEKEELVQQVMAEIFSKDIIGKYDPENVPDDIVFKYDPARGRFRHYLRKIIRNQAAKIYGKRLKNQAANIDDVPEMSAPDAWDDHWNEEWQRHLLTMSLAELKNRVSTETYVAFEMYAVQNRSVQDVADFLNTSVSSIYTAKSRCITLLKEIITNLEEK